jgi:putative tryptophan/tyrosine transport system substrate-binding protein
MRRLTFRRNVAGVCLALVLAIAGPSAQQATRPGAGLPARLQVGVGTIIEHPALNAAIDGFKAALVKAGYKDGDTLRMDVRNANGVRANVATIASGLAGSDANILLAVGTDFARAMADREKRKPVLFTAVTAPDKEKIVATLERPGANVTGASDMNPVREQLSLIRELQPAAKRVGILYNSGETNSVALVDRARAAAPRLGVTLVEATATNTAGVRAAVSSLVGKVDAVYMPTDNTMAAAISTIIDVARTNNIPFYSSESESVMMGGSVAALAIDYRALGVQTGEMALQVLAGRSPATFPVATSRSSLYVNETTARRLKITIPAAVRTRAASVFK